MLVIRSEQMRALQAARLVQFEHRAMAHIDAVMPELGIDAPALRAQVRLGVARGLRHFSAEDELSRYVEIVLRYLGGWSDEDHPTAALEMISSASIPPVRRLDNFERWAKKHRGARAN